MCWDTALCSSAIGYLQDVTICLCHQILMSRGKSCLGGSQGTRVRLSARVRGIEARSYSNLIRYRIAIRGDSRRHSRKRRKASKNARVTFIAWSPDAASRKPDLKKQIVFLSQSQYLRAPQRLPASGRVTLPPITVSCSALSKALARAVIDDLTWTMREGVSRYGCNQHWSTTTPGAPLLDPATLLVF